MILKGSLHRGSLYPRFTCTSCVNALDWISNPVLQDTIAHSPFRDDLLSNVWRAFNTASEAAVTVGFRSSILDLLQLREEQAGELLLAQEALSQTREDVSDMENTLASLTGACNAVLVFSNLIACFFWIL